MSLVPILDVPVRVIARQPCPRCAYVASAKTTGRAIHWLATHLLTHFQKGDA